MMVVQLPLETIPVQVLIWFAPNLQEILLLQTTLTLISVQRIVHVVTMKRILVMCPLMLRPVMSLVHSHSMVLGIALE